MIAVIPISRNIILLSILKLNWNIFIIICVTKILGHLMNILWHNEFLFLFYLILILNLLNTLTLLLYWDPFIRIVLKLLNRLVSYNIILNIILMFFFNIYNSLRIKYALFILKMSIILFLSMMQLINLSLISFRLSSFNLLCYSHIKMSFKWFRQYLYFQ